jgi:CTP:molybdopterin cytidylyltransferase MocA
MTVAAVILAATPESALREVDGVANARRLVDIAWAGGALPVVVLAPDPDRAVAAALAGSPAVLGLPVPATAGPPGQVARAIDLACSDVEVTDAALIWPAGFGWVDPETVTSLIEAHGIRRDDFLRPAFHGVEGWPILLPVVHLAVLRALPADAAPPDLAARLAAELPTLVLELGDPGTVLGLDTPRESLPPYEGPPEPPGDRQHEWGSPAAAGPDELPEPPRTIP